MPSDGAEPATSLPKRPALLHRHSSTSSQVSQSPAESQSHRPSHHKSHKHVVGHGRLGRNPSFHRTLSKVKLAPLSTQQDDDPPPTPRSRQHSRTQSIGSVTPIAPPSPGPRPNMKRTNTSLALPRTNSHSALKKNHSSGQLQRLGSSKHIAHTKPTQRPGVQRSNTQPYKKHPKSPPPVEQKHAHFDMGDDDDDDDGEEMEGVDDQWTEESASASPTTTRDNTRDNTRSNTRQNSVILDPQQNPYARAPKQPPEEVTDDDLTPDATAPEPSNTKSIGASSAPPDQSSKPSSYRDQEESQRALDADAIARRLLQRSQPNNVAPPKVSSISALANANASEPESVSRSQNGPLTTASNTPVVSRFIGDDGGVGSKDATPQQSGFIRGGHHRASSQTISHNDQQDLHRNKSAPNFAQAKSPPGSSGPGSGAVTPDPGHNNSRTQQKLWLQRGLSKIEASSQPHLPGLLPTGRAQAMRTPGAGKNLEFVDKEYAVVRRFVDPLSTGLERVKKMNGGTLPGKSKKQHAEGSNGQAKRPSTSTSVGSRKSSASHISRGGKEPALRSKVSFHTGEAEDDNQEEHDDVGERGQPYSETAAELARRLWEQPITIASEA